MRGRLIACRRTQCWPPAARLCDCQSIGRYERRYTKGPKGCPLRGCEASAVAPAPARPAIAAVQLWLNRPETVSPGKAPFPDYKEGMINMTAHASWRTTTWFWSNLVGLSWRWPVMGKATSSVSFTSTDSRSAAGVARANHPCSKPSERQKIFSSPVYLMVLYGAVDCRTKTIIYRSCWQRTRDQVGIRSLSKPKISLKINDLVPLWRFIGVEGKILVNDSVH
jgi:hypothetical protein